VRTAIITDSVADIPPRTAKELDITVVPLVISFGEESFRDGVDLDSDAFYVRLKAAREFPRTSAPSPGDMARAMDEAAGRAEHVLVITLSTRLSGTYSAATQGRDLSAAADRIHVMDSGWAAMPEGFVAMEAARAAQAGEGLEGVLSAARAAQGRVRLLAAFDSLEYLRRGGRIGAASALLGSLLKINPLIELRDGAVQPAGRTRSRSKAVEQLFSFAAGYGRIDGLAVENTACQEEADELAERLGTLYPNERILRTRMTPVIGAHTGPGLLVVSVLGDRR
jgi:DegV family protein with EDD domain